MTVQTRFTRRILLGLVVVTISLFSAFALVNASLSPAVSVTSGCIALTPDTIPLVGQAGTIRFSCNTRAALSATGTSTPTFSLTTTGYSSLAIVLHTSKVCDQTKILRSGVAVSFGSSRSDYDYCAAFVDPSLVKLGSFKITWTVGKT